MVMRSGREQMISEFIVFLGRKLPKGWAVKADGPNTVRIYQPNSDVHCHQVAYELIEDMSYADAIAEVFRSLVAKGCIKGSKSKEFVAEMKFSHLAGGPNPKAQEYHKECIEYHEMMMKFHTLSRSKQLAFMAMFDALAEGD